MSHPVDPSPPRADVPADHSSASSERRRSHDETGHTRWPLPRILLLALALGLVVIALTSWALDDAPTGDVPAPDATGPAAPAATDPGATTADEPPLPVDAFATREPGDPRALGDVDAPVVMVEWADFLCTFCARFAQDTEPELIRRYVDTGVLRIEWRDLPFQGDDAWLAAIAGQAAAEQDAFWELHERFFELGISELRQQLDHDSLLAIAADLGLDVEAFGAALEDPELVTRVGEEAQVAYDLGVRGTPAFIINGRPVMGAQPLEVFAGAIEQAAADQGVELP